MGTFKTKIPKVKLRLFIKNKDKTIKEYRKYNLPKLAKEEIRHKKFLELLESGFFDKKHPRKFYEDYLLKRAYSKKEMLSAPLWKLKKAYFKEIEALYFKEYESPIPIFAGAVG